MGNTVTQSTLIGGKRSIIKYISLNSDGSQETATVIYDSSALNTVDPLTCTINKITYATSMRNTLGVNGNIKLLFDASTDVLACAIPINAAGVLDFSYFGGLKNTAGTGITGDILITTLGLVAGDAITLILDIIPN